MKFGVNWTFHVPKTPVYRFDLYGRRRTLCLRLGSGASHISQIGNLGLGHMERLIYTKFYIKAFILTLNVITKNYFDQSTGSGNSHISQIGILGSSTHRTSNLHQISCLGLYTNSKCDYQNYLDWITGSGCSHT